jgi:polysaccharide pyruvyl transferase WcaK-like protein
MIKKKLTFITPALPLTNLGDKVIYDSCKSELGKYLDSELIFKGSSKHINSTTRTSIKNSELTFVLGSNLLDFKFHFFGVNQLGFKFVDYFVFKNIVFMGVGFRIYFKNFDFIIKFLYRILFKKSKFKHSVRDTYTFNKLKEIGINNLIMTSCPTLWNLPDIINNTFTLNNVLITLTDYNKNINYDIIFLTKIFSLYKRIFFIPCSRSDLIYFEFLLKKINVNKEKVTILKSKLELIVELKKSIQFDYIGTRLHIGIFCLNLNIPTKIISIDNRAFEIHKDTNIPIIKREEIENIYDEIISCGFLKITLPRNNIKLWINQFSDVSK